MCDIVGTNVAFFKLLKENNTTIVNSKQKTIKTRQNLCLQFWYIWTKIKKNEETHSYSYSLILNNVNIKFILNMY